MTDVSPQTELSRAEIEALQGQVNELKKSQTWEGIGTLLGIPAGTLSGWATGNYPGDAAKVAMRVHRAFAGLKAQRAMARTLPPAPPLQETSATRRMFSTLTFAQMGDMAAIASRPGTGKTESCKAYAREFGRVSMATMSPSSSGVPTALLEILRALDVKEAKGTPQILSAMIRSRVSPGSLLIIDEAQNLSPKALEELRSIHDATGCGIALVGDENLVAVLKAHAQLYSRIGLRVVKLEPQAGDVQVVAEAWGVADPATVKFLTDVARKPGAMRAVTKTMRMATFLADGGLPSLTDIREAYAQNYENAA